MYSKGNKNWKLWVNEDKSKYIFYTLLLNKNARAASKKVQLPLLPNCIITFSGSGDTNELDCENVLCFACNEKPLKRQVFALKACCTCGTHFSTLPCLTLQNKSTWNEQIEGLFDNRRTQKSSILYVYSHGVPINQLEYFTHCGFYDANNLHQMFSFQAKLLKHISCFQVLLKGFHFTCVHGTLVTCLEQLPRGGMTSQSVCWNVTCKQF